MIDGRDLRNYGVRCLRSQMGVVSQEPVLFDGTVEYNISAGCGSKVNRKRVIEAAKLANAHNFIMKWPQVNLTLIKYQLTTVYSHGHMIYN